MISGRKAGEALVQPCRSASCGNESNVKGACLLIARHQSGHRYVDRANHTYFGRCGKDRSNERGDSLGD